VGFLAVILAGCGGDGDDRRIVAGPGLVGLDDTIDETAPRLSVTYTVPATPGTPTVQILSDLASDGDIAFDPVLSSYFVTKGPSTVLFGIDSFNANLPVYRAFLTFPLDGITGQPEVPGDAVILSADVRVFVNLLDFASAVPTFLDLVTYPPAYGGQNGLGSINPAADFNQPPLEIVPGFDFFSSDVGNFVQIEVTSLMQQAQVLQSFDFQLRFSRDMSVAPLAPPSPGRNAGRTVIAPPRSMEGIVPRHPATAKPLSPAAPAERRR
jgi:hypothetical protein